MFSMQKLTIFNFFKKAYFKPILTAMKEGEIEVSLSALKDEIQRANRLYYLHHITEDEFDYIMFKIQRTITKLSIIIKRNKS